MIDIGSSATLMKTVAFVSSWLYNIQVAAPLFIPTCARSHSLLMMALPQSLWFVCVWVIYISSVTAQNFGVPSAWRVRLFITTFVPIVPYLPWLVNQKPTIYLSLQDRLSLVDGLLGTVNQSFNSLTGQFNGISCSNIHCDCRVHLHRF